MSKPLTGPFVYAGEITAPATNLPAIRAIRTDNSSDLAIALIETLSDNQVFARGGRTVRVTVTVDVTVNPDALPSCPRGSERGTRDL